MVNKIWTDLKQRVKPILTSIREQMKKEAEQSLSDGIEGFITQIHGQNTSNMNLYNENMTTLV